MRIVIQRVSQAQVRINNIIKGKITKGFVIFLGIETTDEEADIKWLCKKIIGLRVFSDEEGHMNNAIRQIEGELLVISQFTLHALTKKGNRPSFIKAARPGMAEPLYKGFIDVLQEALGKTVQSGAFGAYMEVELTNDGPVTIIIDSKNKE